MADKMVRILKKIWDKGYLYHYVLIFPSDQWWNLWHIPLLFLFLFLATLIPTPTWLTSIIADKIVDIITIIFFGVFLVIAILLLYLMMTDPVVDGKIFPRTRIRK